MNKLYEYRVLRRLSQKSVSKELGISQPFLSMLETGAKKPSREMFDKIEKLIKG
ncbi:helix-turn-helix transcriptional regulator [Evansella cellulosilytica]|uniref:helix-turn-helix transcriptional regulator n=1 Tax=Evansella cellulosilytica TaxID=1413 RepID=UPI0001C28B87|nr:helix-turn-helix transcriptional regulator [Evansella cellulosilytica]